MEDSMSKRGGGVCGPPMAQVWGGRMNQLMVQVDGRGSRLCGVEGEILVEVWRGGKVLVACGARPFAKGRAPLQEGHPFGGGRALVACLVGRGSSPSRRFGDFLLFFHAAKS